VNFLISDQLSPPALPVRLDAGRVTANGGSAVSVRSAAPEIVSAGVSKAAASSAKRAGPASSLLFVNRFIRFSTPSAIAGYFRLSAWEMD
jgi:hypothetical protein